MNAKTEYQKVTRAIKDRILVPIQPFQKLNVNPRFLSSDKNTDRAHIQYWRHGCSLVARVWFGVDTEGAFSAAHGRVHLSRL